MSATSNNMKLVHWPLIGGLRAVASPHSLGFPSSPFPSPPLTSLPIHPLISCPLPSHLLPLQVGPLLRLGNLGERSSSPSRSGRSPSAKRFLVNCRLKIAPVVGMVLRRFTRDTSTWSIAKNAIRYLVRQSQHTVYCAMGTKSFNAVMVRIERRQRRMKDTPKAMHQWCFRGIFPGCRLQDP